MQSQSSATSVSENGGKVLKSFWLSVMVLSLATLAHAQAPAINSSGVVNAASGVAEAVAPGSIVSIFGTNLASSTVEATSIPLPTKLGDVTSVTFNNVPAPLIYVSALQINAQVPWNVLPTGNTSVTASVVVTRSSGASPAQTVPVVLAQPGIFTVPQNGAGQAIATNNANGQLAATATTAAASPIAVGDYLIVWCTGLGAVSPSVANGAVASGSAFSNTVLTPVVTIGGVPATLVYSVLSPQYVGLYQIGVQVAPGTPSGNVVPLEIESGGVTTSEGVTVAVQADNASPVAEFSYNGSTSFVEFNATTANLPGIRQWTFTGCPTPPCRTLPMVGSQGGDLVNGYSILDPWRVQCISPSGQCPAPIPGSSSPGVGVPNSVVLVYTAANGTFDSPSAWSWYDMESNPAYSATCLSITNPGTPGTGVYCPYGYNNGVVIGDNYYLIPSAVGRFYPVFVMINTATGPTNASSYSFQNGCATACAGGVVIGGDTQGNGRGWAQSVVTENRYLWYTATSLSTNFVMHDTSMDTGNVLSSSGWYTNDPVAESCPGMSSMEGAIGAAYDGHQYIYYPPTNVGATSISATVLAILDATQISQFGSGSCSPWSALDISHVGAGGSNPQLMGVGNQANLHGFGGAQIISTDTTNGVQYLYLLPTDLQNIANATDILSAQFARVQIGKYTNGVWSAVPITSPNATWEMYDAAQLTSNPAWSVYDLGATNQTVGTCGTPPEPCSQNVLAGFEEGWINTHDSPNLVCAESYFARFDLCHDPNKALADPSGWTVVKIDAADLGNNSYGGPYDPVNQTEIPSIATFPPNSFSNLVYIQMKGL